MIGYGIETFGELNAEDYDETQDPGTTDQCVALISEIAGTASILEFAIGTGRIALPLVAKGHSVAGIESSPKMVEKLREKPGGSGIEVHMGDMSSARVNGSFGHVCLVFNTLFNLTSQQAQIACFQNAAAHLDVGGTFLVETFVPKTDHFVNHQTVQTRHLKMDSVWIEAIQHDPVRQVLDFQRIRYSPEGTKLVPLTMRYAHIPELDVIAQLAGLRLRDRWGGWDKRGFDKDSTMHISVYEKI